MFSGETTETEVIVHIGVEGILPLPPPQPQSASSGIKTLTRGIEYSLVMAIQAGDVIVSLRAPLAYPAIWLGRPKGHFVRALSLQKPKNREPHEVP